MTSIEKFFRGRLFGRTLIDSAHSAKKQLV